MPLALKLALAPLLLAQGLHARRTLPKLPEADGPRRGCAGRGELRLSLLIVGDSSAAGVGVATQDQALAGHLPPALARRLGGQVRWALCARSGITTAQAASLLDEAGDADVAVVVTGVNDVTGLVPVARALAAREALQAALHQRCGARQVVWSPVPPMGRFAGLPQPLRWVLGRDAAAHGQALADWARLQPRASHLPFDLPVDDPALLAVDGFHPGAPLYRRWGEALAAHIADAVWPRL